MACKSSIGKLHISSLPAREFKILTTPREMYTIQGIIGNAKIFDNDLLVGGQFVSLPQSMAIILFVSNWIKANKIPFLPHIAYGAKTLPAPIVDLCHYLSANGKIVYIYAVFFGGEGAQACSLWDKGVMIGNPQVDVRTFNTALQFFGVEKGTNLQPSGLMYFP